MPDIMKQVQEMNPESEIDTENLVAHIVHTIESNMDRQLPVIITEKAYTDDPGLLLKALRPTEYSPKVITKVYEVIRKAKQRSQEMK